VTFRLTTPDFWQHLVVGKAIWQLGSIPQEHLWTWPSHGTHEVLPSWGFRWLLWPFYSAGGMLGLQVWRWLTTLAAFAIAWARSFGEFGPVLVFSGATRLKTEVLSTTVFLELSVGRIEAAAAVSLFMVVVAMVVLVVLRFFGPADAIGRTVRP